LQNEKLYQLLQSNQKWVCECVVIVLLLGYERQVAGCYICFVAGTWNSTKMRHWTLISSLCSRRRQNLALTWVKHSHTSAHLRLVSWTVMLQAELRGNCLNQVTDLNIYAKVTMQCDHWDSNGRAQNSFFKKWYRQTTEWSWC
jgi:hypothetical protein